MNWKKNVKACIFDLDGVIVDTAKYHYIAWKKIAHNFAFDFDEEFNEKLKGVSRVESLKLILEAAGKYLTESDFEKTLFSKNTHYLSLIKSMNESEILPGVLPYLKNLQENNIHIALGSASKNAKTILKQVGLIDYFEIISDGTMVSKSKPDPEVFLICSDFFGLEPKHCVVFEDSIKGVQAANTGGFQSIGLGKEEVLSEAKIVYSSFENRSPEELSVLFQN